MGKKTEEKSWENRFKELVDYNEKNGNCNVPQNQGALGIWVNNQRRIHKKGKLSQEHTTQLEGIAFNWGTQKKTEDKPWVERFNELVVYKEKNNHCNVPQRQGTLGKWVDHQ